MKNLLLKIYPFLFAALLSGCSVFNNPMTKTGNPQQTTEKKANKPDKKNTRIQAKPAADKTARPVQQQKTKPETKPKAPSKNKKTSSGKATASISHKTAVTPLDSAAIAPAATTIAPHSTLSFKALAGEWFITKVNGQSLKGDDRPYIYFDPAKNSFYAYNGCNYINGTLTSAGDETLSMDNMAVSMRTCGESSSIEYLIINALPEIKKFDISTRGEESLLTLRNSSSREMMTLCRHNIGFANGAWTVMAIGNDETVNNDNLRLVIDVTEHKLHGFAGCNIINGKIFIDPDNCGSIQFTDITSSRMTCPDIAVESRLLAALEEVASCTFLKDGTMLLKEASGKTVLKLKPFEL